MCRALIWREYNCAEEWEVALSLWPKKQVKSRPKLKIPTQLTGGEHELGKTVLVWRIQP